MLYLIRLKLFLTSDPYFKQRIPTEPPMSPFSNQFYTASLCHWPQNVQSTALVSARKPPSFRHTAFVRDATGRRRKITLLLEEFAHHAYFTRTVSNREGHCKSGRPTAAAVRDGMFSNNPILPSTDTENPLQEKREREGKREKARAYKMKVYRSLYMASSGEEREFCWRNERKKDGST